MNNRKNGRIEKWKFSLHRMVKAILMLPLCEKIVFFSTEINIIFGFKQTTNK